MPRLIDVDALLETLCNNCSYCGRCRVPCMQYDMIALTPTIDAEPVRHGRWIDRGDYVTTAYGSLDLKTCSECNTEVTLDGYDYYCPNCGAKMDLEVQDD